MGELLLLFGRGALDGRGEVGHCLGLGDYDRQRAGMDIWWCYGERQVY